ncbi:MAG TPA: ankyrin repeat domain-containing protein [Terriglobia bacterium]|nr:ankyrin repeat domain-containing protein [Terriglobia bacterium]
MSDAIPLPPHPNLEQYRKLARDFQHACKSSASNAIHDWAVRWTEKLARLQGLEITADVRKQIGWEVEAIERLWSKLRDTNVRVTPCALTNAQFFVARVHGFAGWPKFTRHLESLALANSPVSKFETAADSIVNGDSPTLERLLHENPALVRARSTREHRSTLLHYVSANGVEDFRQKTPKNIIEITKLLLNAGSDVNATSEAYGGRSTTLGLTATSWHPQNAGVQLGLMEVLIDHGAIIDGPDGGSRVNGCLHNGRGDAAEFFASRGARLDLEGAAGVGRLDVVQGFFNDDGGLKSSATQQQMKDAFTWACEFGRTSVVDFLLQRGMNVDAKLKHDGQTGLHWAAYHGHLDTARLLLQRGAPVDAKDENYGGTPLGWALYAWGNSLQPAKVRSTGSGGRYYEVVSLLIQAGAKVDPQWYEEDEDRQRAATKGRTDPRMVAALRGETPPE